jgi:serine phosphatase RsbU (regulator of sigma subunit)
MFFGARAVGALNIYCREERCFTQDQFYVLSLLAAHGAVALSNARAHRQLRVQAADVRASFQRVGAALTASLDIGDTLRLIVQLAVEMTHSNGGAMFMMQTEEEGGGLLLSAAQGLDRRSIRRFRRMPVAGLAQQALDEKRVIVVSDTRLRPDIAFPTLRDFDDDDAAETRSVVCVPVLAGNRPVGVLEQYAARPDAFEHSDIQLLSSFAHQASVAIENARLYAQERGIAQTLQRSFLPELPHAISGFQIGRIYAPGSEVSAVGGDTYDLFTLPDGRIAALIADVSGQGTSAATLAVMAKYTVRAYALEDPEPSSVVRRVNNALVHQTGDSTFLTLCYALIDPSTRKVTMARAAHPPPILCRADKPGKCEALEEMSGLIAGFLPNQEFNTEEIVMETGDILVFYTDGVIEARRRKVMFEQERLMQAIHESAGQSAQEIAGAIYAAVSDYTQGVLNDDIALLVLKAE